MLYRLALVIAFSLAFWPALTPLQGQKPNVQTVQGQVEDSQGAPVSAALVQLSNWNGGTLQSQVSDGSGTFSFLVHSQGPFLITVTTPFGTEQAPVDGAAMDNILVKIPNAQPRSVTDAAHSVVSINDLEASGKSKSKLADANKALQKRDFGKAWKLVNEAIRDSPNWGRPYVLRGVLHFVQNDFASAYADFSTAVARNPKNAVALTQMGKLEATTGHLKQAQMYFDRALSIPPVQWPTYLEMADLDLRLHNYRGAAAMASEAMHCTPPPPPLIHYFAAEAADFLGNQGEALAQYQMFVAKGRKEPNYAAAHAHAEERIQQLTQQGVRAAAVAKNGGHR